MKRHSREEGLDRLYEMLVFMQAQTLKGNTISTQECAALAEVSATNGTVLRLLGWVSGMRGHSRYTGPDIITIEHAKHLRAECARYNLAIRAVPYVPFEARPMPVVTMAINPPESGDSQVLDVDLTHEEVSAPEPEPFRLKMVRPLTKKKPRRRFSILWGLFSWEEL